MKKKQDLVYQVLLSALVANAPKDTWNLALNGIRLIQSNGSWSILIGGEVAPYAEHTNEKWIRGQNPNEGWIQATVEQVLPIIKSFFEGAITEEEILKYQEETFNERLITQFEEHIAFKELEYENI